MMEGLRFFFASCQGKGLERKTLGCSLHWSFVCQLQPSLQLACGERSHKGRMRVGILWHLPGASATAAEAAARTDLALRPQRWARAR